SEEGAVPPVGRRRVMRTSRYGRALLLMSMLGYGYGCGGSSASGGSGGAGGAGPGAVGGNAPASGTGGAGVGGPLGGGSAGGAGGAASVAPGAVTSWQDVAPIYSEKCVPCHQTGGIAPFPLDNYTDALTNAALELAETAAGDMPPYFMVHDGSCGSFEDSRTL